VQKAVKSVQNINEKWDWKAEPLRFDPRRNYLLCEHCWNGLHWSPGFIGANGAKHQKSKLCLGNGCGCGCNDKGPRKVKFTGEGQMKIDTGNDVIRIAMESSDLTD
jgi:hypothetical protein